jgi:hypothetical protein
VCPKPMVEVGERPILGHIMEIYDHFWFRRFMLPVGYLGEVVKAHFLSYADRHAGVTVNTLWGDLVRHNHPPESWNVTVVDAGVDTMTGGRLRRLDCGCSSSTSPMDGSAQSPQLGRPRGSGRSRSMAIAGGVLREGPGRSRMDPRRVRRVRARDARLPGRP